MHFDQVEMADEQEKQTNQKEPDFTFQHFFGFHFMLRLSKWRGNAEYILFFKEKIEREFWFST